MENVRNRIRVKFIRKDGTNKIIKLQSKITLNGIHKSYENYDSYTFIQNKILMDKPIYLDFSVLALSKILIIKTYSYKLQPYFGLEN